MRLGCGVSPMTKLVNAGINVCLGTDGQGSGDNFSMFELMRIASYLQKGVNADSNLLDSYDALKMATINGAKALGIENKTGSIEVGKNADLNILFFRSINMYPINNPIDNIVYNATDDEIETTIINGKIVREKNNFVNLKKDELLNSMEQIRKNMSKYLEKAIKDSSKR
jgi:5-methylthioadenosine/S-adenosylhomocysteine deaminase